MKDQPVIYFNPTAREVSPEVSRHNAYAWVKPDADACYLCGRKSFHTPCEGFSVRECDKCERLVGECCAEIEADESSLSWQCDSMKGGCGPRDYVTEFNQACDEICNRLADNLEAVDRKLGLEPRDRSTLRQPTAEFIAEREAERRAA